MLPMLGTPTTVLIRDHAVPPWEDISSRHRGQRQAMTGLLSLVTWVVVHLLYHTIRTWIITLLIVMVRTKISMNYGSLVDMQILEVDGRMLLMKKLHSVTS